MNTPHEVRESKDFNRNWRDANLTAQDVSDIIGEIALQRRFDLENYELAALHFAQEFIENFINEDYCITDKEGEK